MKWKEIKAKAKTKKYKVKIITVLFGVFFIVGFDYYDSGEYTPILMLRSELEKSIQLDDAKPLKEPGKIYAKGNFLYINEKQEGIHVIDNSDPNDPKNIGFINIPGNVDIAIKKNILYVDNAVDLVAIDLSAYPDIKVTKRVQSIFPEPLPPGHYSMPEKYMPRNRPSHTIIIKWVKKGTY